MIECLILDLATEKKKLLKINQNGKKWASLKLYQSSEIAEYEGKISMNCFF